MLAKLSNKLFGINIVKADRTMVCHCTQHFFHKMRKLALVNCTSEVRLRLDHLTILNIQNLIITCTIRGIKKLLCSKEIHDTSLIARSHHLIIAVKRDRCDGRKLLLEAIFLHHRLFQNCRQLFALKVPDLSLAVTETSTKVLRILRKD